MADVIPTPAARTHRRGFLRLFLLCLLTIAILLHPVSNGWTRTAAIVLPALCWLWLLRLFWRRNSIRGVLLGLPAILVVFLLMPGFNWSQSSLQARYADALRSYEGTRYVWGGENCLGIDCSGLARGALIKASWQESLQTANPGLLRFSIRLWWNDCSARALADEYKNQTLMIATAESINSIPVGHIQPGDMAVTHDGIHVLACLGGNRWIEADPDAGKVLTVETPSTNAWFESPVKIVRWTIFAQPRGSL